MPDNPMQIKEAVESLCSPVSYGALSNKEKHRSVTFFKTVGIAANLK